MGRALRPQTSKCHFLTCFSQPKGVQRTPTEIDQILGTAPQCLADSNCDTVSLTQDTCPASPYLPIHHSDHTHFEYIDSANARRQSVSHATQCADSFLWWAQADQPENRSRTSFDTLNRPLHQIVRRTLILASCEIWDVDLATHKSDHRHQGGARSLLFTVAGCRTDRHLRL